jgi:hypothetical protein
VGQFNQTVTIIVGRQRWCSWIKPMHDRDGGVRQVHGDSTQKESPPVKHVKKQEMENEIKQENVHTINI